MKIKSIVINRDQVTEAEGSAPAITMVEMSGPVDPHSEVVREARRVIASLDSDEALRSFDAAIASGSFIPTS